MKHSTKTGIVTCLCLFSLVLSMQRAKGDALDQWTGNTVTPEGYRPYGSRPYAITFGNGLYVAVGEDELSDLGFIITSKDGVNWTTAQPFLSAFFLDMYDVTYANGKFVAVGYDYYWGQNIYSSTNGVDWTRHSQPFNYNLFHVAGGEIKFGGMFVNIFVAVGNGGPVDSGTPSGYSVLLSYDGENWFEADPNTVASGGVGTDLAYGAGSFVFVNGGVFRSVDGYEWTKTATNAASNVNFCNGKFMVPTSGGRILTSTNGLTWSISTNDPAIGLGRIVYKSGNYLALGPGGFWSSTNGINWAQHTAPMVPTNNLQYSAGYLDIAIGATNAVALTYYSTTNPPPYHSFAFAAVSGSFLDLSPAAPGQVTISGLLGRSYSIQAMDALGGTNQWQPIETFSLPASPFTWTDPQPAALPSRFYRAILLP